MPLSDLECPVCYMHYSRQNRVPRSLNCCHTFCTPCLAYMSQWDSTICTIRCPLCRWTTCIRPPQGPQEALWVDSDLWERISDFKEDKEEEEIEEPPYESATSKHPRDHRTLPKVLRQLIPCIWPEERTPALQHEPLFKVFKDVQSLVRKSTSAACSSSAACHQATDQLAM